MDAKMPEETVESMLEAGKNLGGEPTYEFVPEAVGVVWATAITPDGEIINVTARGSSLIGAINELVQGLAFAKNTLGWQLVRSTPQQTPANPGSVTVNNHTPPTPAPDKANQQRLHLSEVRQRGGDAFQADVIEVVYNQKAQKPQLNFIYQGKRILSMVVFDISKTLSMLAETGESWDQSNLVPGQLRTGTYTVYWVPSNNGQYKNVKFIV